MANCLVIVESPTKAKTISSILGKDYEVISSMGHLIDLPPKTLGIDVKNNFEPTYKIIPGKKKLVAQIKKKAKNKGIIYLATDLDREGEAISWHIHNLLAEDNKTSFKRVVFYEITAETIKESFNKGGELDVNKFNSQKARRILDRIVGFYLSPLLWKKIIRGLSAGRVQSVALKFIVQREKQIKKFKPQYSYEIEGTFIKKQQVLPAKLKKFKNNKGVFKTNEQAQEACTQIREEEFAVSQVKKRQYRRKPPPPFTTSLLQQAAFNKLRFSSKKTMMLAQRLYEGIDIEGKPVGLITYMRTDSFHVADKAKKQARDYIGKELGQDYLQTKQYRYKQKKGAQLAHEAIRPTAATRTPDSLRSYLTQDQYRLYDLIWRRFLASFIKEAVFESTKVSIKSEESEFYLEGKRNVFDGFLKIAGDNNKYFILPPLDKGDMLALKELEVKRRETKPPPRFNDASLVKILEEKGIGRPSTYAPIISTLIRRNYISKEKGYFHATDLGIEVSDMLVDNFPEIMDEGFTAKVEQQLDKIEQGELSAEAVLNNFYPQFKKSVDDAAGTIKKSLHLVDKKCPKCGRPMAIKWSRKGKFLSCSGFPQCKYAENITTGINCPQCKQGELIRRRNRRGQFFYGCSNFPKCRYTSSKLPQQEEGKPINESSPEDD
jgi:DNA topoisomerase-1